MIVDIYLMIFVDIYLGFRISLISSLEYVLSGQQLCQKSVSHSPSLSSPSIYYHGKVYKAIYKASFCKSMFSTMNYITFLDFLFNHVTLGI